MSTSETLGTSLDLLEGGALDATSAPKTFMKFDGAPEKLRLLEYFSGLRIPTNPCLRLANAAVNFCGNLFPFTWTVFGLTVFWEELKERIRSYPLYVAFVFLVAVMDICMRISSTTVIKRALREPSKKRLVSTEEHAAQGLLRTALLHETDVASLSLGKLPFTMAQSEPLTTILLYGNRWPRGAILSITSDSRVLSHRSVKQLIGRSCPSDLLPHHKTRTQKCPRPHT